MSNKIWFLFKDNHHIGPFSTQEVKEKFDAGEFSTSIPVWREGDPQWIPLANQTELASFVIPTEIVELPPLPPLPDEVYEDTVPGQDPFPSPSEESMAQEIAAVENIDPVDIDGKLETLEKELPKESVDTDSFWAPDLNEAPEQPEEVPYEEPVFETEVVDDAETNVDSLEESEESSEIPDFGSNATESSGGTVGFLKEKLKNVRSRLGDDTDDTELEDDDRPIRENQFFDGDDDIPEENSLQSKLNSVQNKSTSISENIEPTKEELAAINAPNDSSVFLSEDEEEEIVQDPALESFTKELKSEAEDIVDRDDFLEEEEDLEYEGEGREFDEFDEFEEQGEKPSRFWLKIVASVVILAIIGITTSQLFFQKKKIPSLDKLSKTDARSFREVIDNNSNRFSYRFAVTDDKTMNVWFATNQAEPGILVIRMESKDKRVLAKDKIVATSKAEVLGHVTRLDSFRVVEGQRLVDGEYQLTGTFKVGGIKAKILDWLKYNTPLGKTAYLRHRKSVYNINTSFFYTRDKGEKFREELAKYWEDIRVKKTAPLLVEIQKWRTLKTLSEQVSNLFVNLINLPKKSIKEISDEFSKQYAEQIAPVFQTLTIDTQSLLQDNKDLLPVQVSRLEYLLKLQKSFGLNVTYNLESLGKYKKLTKSIIDSLDNEARQRHTDFVANVDKKIKEIQTQLENI